MNNAGGYWLIAIVIVLACFGHISSLNSTIRMQEELIADCSSEIERANYTIQESNRIIETVKTTNPYTTHILGAIQSLQIAPVVSNPCGVKKG